MLLNISNKYIYEKDIETGKRSIRFIRPEEHNESGETIHYPHFLIIAQDGQDINELLNTIQERIQREGNDFYSPYSNIVCDEDGMPYHTIQEKRSYIDPYTRYVTASICVLPSYKVPAVSTALFKDYGMYTAEFDIPYRDRAFIDLGATDQKWVLDTEGKEAKIDLLCYDIEAMEYDATREFNDDDAEKEYLKGIPIDMIGWAATEFKYRAEHDLDTEDFDFEITDIPDWHDPEVKQIIASTEVEEMEMLETFISQVMKTDMIAGHNVMSYDNMHVYYRIQHFLEEQIPARTRYNFETFCKKYCEPSRVWISQWGKMLQTVNFYPFTFDTLPAAMKAYFFLDRHNLKFMAQYLGIKIPDRIYLTQYEMTQAWESGENLKRFAKYNEHDVREQLGVTLSLLTNSLPVCHTTNLPADISMPSGTTNIWDIAAHMRAFREGIIFPPKLKYIEVAKWLVHNITERDKIDIATTIRRMLNQGRSNDIVDRGVVKLVKYGNEMNDLALFPHIMYNAYAIDEVTDIINGNDAMTKYCNCPTCRRIKEALPDNFDPDNAEHKEIYENWLKERFEKESEGALDSKHSIREDRKGYHFPGGMTIKPQDQNSEYKLWYETKVADVGAMYPSNVKAEEIGGDTSRFVKPRYYKLDLESMADPDKFDPTLSYQYIQRKDMEDVDFRDELLRWVWFKRLPDDFVQARTLGIYYKDLNNNPKYRNLKKMYPFVDRGYLIAVAIDQEKGCVASALTGIMKVIQKIKVNMIEMEESGAGSKEDIKKLEKIKMMYQSMKGMRNAATHGILSAPTVSCRQTNLWGAARITTLGQQCLEDALKEMDDHKIRVVYGDTDGIYLACSRTAHTNPRMTKALGIEQNANKKYLTHPKTIENIIEKLNTKWQKILDYPKFELEIEEHDATFYIKHKNYLMFDVKEDENDELSIHMGIKGANLKARDKPTFARKFLKVLMKKYLNKHIDWTDRTEKEETLQSIKDIKSLTKHTLEDVNVENEDIKNLLLIQGVKPIHEYKVLKRKCSICKGTNMMTDCCKCGTKNLGDTFICEQCGESEPDLVECLYCAYGRQYHYYGKRANSLQHVLGHEIDSSIKLGLLVCKKPMPYYARPKKSPSKPLPYMWPKDKVEEDDIDYDWYETMILHYIKGGFGFGDWNIDTYEIMEREKYVDVTLMPRYFMHVKRSNRKTSDRIEVDVSLFSKYKKGDKIIGYQLPL